MCHGRVGKVNLKLQNALSISIFKPPQDEMNIKLNSSMFLNWHWISSTEGRVFDGPLKTGVCFVHSREGHLFIQWKTRFDRRCSCSNTNPAEGIQMCLQAGGACLVSQPGHMLSICVCGLAEGRPRARCYVSALVGRGRRIVPILLFWSASFPSSSHLVGAQPTAEVKEWIARTTVLHPDSSPERRLDPTRLWKSLHSSHPREGGCTEK